MRFLGRLPIAHKVALALATIAVLTLGTMWLIVANNLNSLLKQQTHAVGDTLAMNLAKSAVEARLADDLLSLNVIVTNVAETTGVRSAQVLDSNHKVLAHSNSPSSTSSPKQELFQAPMTINGVIAGYAQIELDGSIIAETIKRSLMLMSISAAVVFVVAMMFTVILTRHLTRPISDLTRAAKEIHAGNLEFRLSEKRHDEFGTLIRSFNEMARGLLERDKLKNSFSQYVPKPVATNLLGTANGTSKVPLKTMNATVMFTDMVEFTQLCEHRSADEVAEILNGYYDNVIRSCESYHGLIDKFIGDGAMVLFDNGDHDSNHALNAICAARLFLTLIKHSNKQRRLEGKPSLHFRIGIHTGKILAGSLGSQDRMQYTAVGDTVNLASRLCDLCQHNSLLISDQTWKHAGGSTHLRNTPQPRSQTIRGKRDVVTAYQVDHLEHSLHCSIAEKAEQLAAASDAAVASEST